MYLSRQELQNLRKNVVDSSFIYLFLSTLPRLGNYNQLLQTLQPLPAFKAFSLVFLETSGKEADITKSVSQYDKYISIIRNNICFNQDA